MKKKHSTIISAIQPDDKDKEELEELIAEMKKTVMETQQAEHSLADVTARHKDILELENNLREVHEMLVDMATLVESQDEIVDNIEFNVKTSVDYVDTAAVDAERALKYQGKARQKNRIIFSIGLAMFVVILVIVIIIAAAWVMQSNVNSKTVYDC